MALVGAATIVTDLAPEHRRGEALSIFSLGLWGGLALGPLIGELVLGDTRFDAVWLLAASCCLAAGLIGLLLPETAPSRDSGRALGCAPRPSRRRSARASCSRSPSSASRASARSARCMRATSASTEPAPSSSRSRRSSSRRASSRARCRTGSGRSARPESRSALIAAGLFTVGLWNVPAGLFVGTVVVAFGHALAFPSLMTLAVNSAPASERSSVVGHVQRVHRARLPRWRAQPRSGRLDGRLRRRVRRLRVRAAPRRAGALAARPRRRRVAPVPEAA